MPAPPAGWAHARILFAWGDDSPGIGVDLLIAGDPTSANLDDVMASILAAWVDTMLPLQTSGLYLAGGSIMYSDGTAVIEGTATADEPGGVDGGGLPANCALVLSGKLEEHYRGGKPRIYMPGVPSSALADNNLYTGTYTGDAETAYAGFNAEVNLISEGGASSVSQGVWHKVRDKVELDPWTFSPLIGTGVQKRVCSQRRRTGRLIAE
jgi:hypothetical protein